jgi:hypothetical protein
MDKLNNLTDTKGNKCFDVELKDFMTVDIEAVLQDLKDNKDNVYIISHGALKVNGKFWKYWYYYWNNDNDKVEEGFCRDGRSDFTDFKQFEKMVNPKNIFACFLSEGDRKYRRFPWETKFSRMVQKNDIMSRLKDALEKYYNEWSRQKGAFDCKCPKKVIVYEGEDRGDPTFCTEKAMKCPLHEESFYHGL